MQLLPTFQLSKNTTRIWDLDVPVLIDKEKNVIEAYITNAIEEPCLYNELCYLIKNSAAGTTIYININTPGGIIDSAFMIANAISHSKATVVGVLSGTVASAGTLIAMACHELEVSPHVSFMIHNYSGGMAGKGHEMKARQKFTDDHLNDAFTSFYSGFLSKEEMEKVIEGTDIWMTTAEVVTRWEERVAYVKGQNNE
jgi:ATP-dependent protease ClpP protease subunit